MDNLRNILKAEETISENMDISIEEARKLIKDASFSEYLSLMEASVDKSTQHQTDQQASFQSNITTSSDTAQNNQPQQKAEPKAGHKYVIPDESGNDVELTYIGNGQFRDSAGKTIDAKNDLEDEDSALTKAVKGIGGAIGTIGKSFTSGLRAGMQEDADLHRLRKLSGISETTTSGSVASSPSIVGDTSDSHKPTVQLRKRLRLEKEKAEKAKAKMSKKSESGKD